MKKLNGLAKWIMIAIAALALLGGSIVGTYSTFETKVDHTNDMKQLDRIEDKVDDLLWYHINEDE